MKIRTAVPFILMAAMFAAGPASADSHKKDTPNHKSARANFASCAKPMYPADAIKTNRVGTVTLGFEIGTDGKVIDSKVEKSSGHADLDEAAQTAIKLCKFEAATQDGKPVQEWMKMQYVWSLK
ncbi:MAG: energy transducer TonB [Pseudomonadota bacterium]